MLVPAPRLDHVSEDFGNSYLGIAGFLRLIIHMGVEAEAASCKYVSRGRNWHGGLPRASASGKDQT
ncbi:hypothetical protein [Rhizobium sp. CC-YZS058]|uniref:hypothetical protein n=1 Tax=Rhizobium sp. CC-YZS058 TaxID=3042153 RepID=UPI002B05BE2E|nr:hypothetical protein [Rhizobium sp. CC-YZS058]